ncbi:putative two-component system sensor kinase [Actinoplanes missouriensis 431]|uniref:histidine kinase n=1 Tax=Actinoplanes missouriensis (strain ATCC 14538 / DSM 43046 / CBS 188.64 / JCM 3121 / NBRC 102363 / NCIMB 12654 / NRRL B-3342 / UNCC 431) TaxID=512565 RepID=I0H8W2_ACTM4|nr:sensor histidine kinase [Actinoplanes missouriensis]BAL89449.1 putative two-component system sensor kinase [Actinoplanes missouriensis 431]
MRRWPRSSRTVDAAVAAVACAAAAGRVAVAPVLPADRAPDLTAYLMVLGMGVALLARRRAPAAVLALVGALFFGYHMLEYPGGAPAVPLWVALYTVGAATHRRTGLVVAAVILWVDAQSRMTLTGVGPFDATLDGSTVVFVAALLLGEVVRGRRERITLLAADRDRTLTQRLTEERMSIARELHDVTAHTLAVVTVQAGVAADVIEDDPGQARAALTAVRDAAGEAMAELRAAVGVLRDGSRPDGPVPTLERLPELAAGTGATLIRQGTPRPLPRAVEATAYRILQEAVANAVRHAGGGRVEMIVGYQRDGLSLSVTDGGPGSVTDGGPGSVPVTGSDGGAGSVSDTGSGHSDGHSDGDGFGIRGMTERAQGLGGWLRAGPGPAGGFRVRAWLPG